MTRYDPMAAPRRGARFLWAQQDQGGNLNHEVNVRTTRLLSLPKFAQLVGISYWLARELVIRGEIPSVPVGTRKRIDIRWVKQWLAAGGYCPSTQDARNKHGL